MTILVDLNTRVIYHQGMNYVFENNQISVILDDNVMFIFGTLNNTNAEVYEIENPIEDFIGGKYLYNDEVILNPDWVELDA